MSEDKKSKVCKTCQVDKPLTDYYRTKRTYLSYCKPCHNIRTIRNGKKARAERRLVFKRITLDLYELEKLKDIRDDLKRMTQTNASKKHGVGQSTLSAWLKTGALDAHIESRSAQ